MAVTIAGRTSLAGEEVDVLLLAGGQRWCAAIHLDTGALFSARWDEPVEGLAPMLVARAVVAGDQGDTDPARPDELVLDGPPLPRGPASRRRAEKLLRPVLHPAGEHLLGFAGPAIPYWTLDGTRPSVAVVAPSPAPVVAGGRCRFRWRHVPHTLPLLPQALDGPPRHARRLVITLSAPRQGYCYKVVAGLL
ncbi:MAG TPA: hypothetical protein VFJ85_14410 [Acidimicrobiales bacterium]|nr:hypothetical protein [Acidimicrobiales bacterium]